MDSKGITGIIILFAIFTVIGMNVFLLLWANSTKSNVEKLVGKTDTKTAAPKTAAPKAKKTEKADAAVDLTKIKELFEAVEKKVTDINENTKTLKEKADALKTKESLVDVNTVITDDNVKKVYETVKNDVLTKNVKAHLDKINTEILAYFAAQNIGVSDPQKAEITAKLVLADDKLNEAIYGTDETAAKDIVKETIKATVEKVAEDIATKTQELSVKNDAIVAILTELLKELEQLKEEINKDDGKKGNPAA